MCLGIPMQVVEAGEGHAWCDTGDGLRRIDTLLVGQPAVGAWLMTFLDTAREIISAEDAARVRDALQAVALAMRGEAGIDHLFADLVGREPTLPAFLAADAAPAPPDDPRKGE